MSGDRSAQYVYEFGPFRLIVSERLLLREGEPVPLQHRAFDTLLLLIQNQGQLLSKDDLLKRVWPDVVVGENSLAQAVSALRKALGQQPHEHKFIETDPGRGYRFVARVRKVREQGVDGAGRASNHSSPPEIARAVLSIAILPFRPLGSEGHDEYFELGMADALVTKLSNVTQLVVRPTSAVRGHDDWLGKPLMAGQKLRVDAVLEGSIQRCGDGVRVTVQLVRVSDGMTLWAARFDEYFTGIFALQDTISEQVAGALLDTLSGEEQRRLARRHTESAEAYQAYFKGRYYWNKRTEEWLKKGIRHFQQAIDLDPGYALAYAGLADSYSLLGMLDCLAPPETFPKAKAAALKALELDETLAEAHTSLAQVQFYYDWNWRESEQTFLRALRLNPNYATAHHWYGWYLTATGRFDQALAELRRAQELDPLSLVISTALGGALYLARQYQQAINQCRKILDLAPDFALTHYCLALVYVKTGQYQEAIAEARQAIDLSGGSPLMIATLGCAYLASGELTPAERALDELQELGRQRYVSSYYTAVMYAHLGRRELAFEWFDRAYQEHSNHLVWSGLDPSLDNLRADPGFRNLIRVSLPCKKMLR